MNEFDGKRFLTESVSEMHKVIDIYDEFSFDSVGHEVSTMTIFLMTPIIELHQMTSKQGVEDLLFYLREAMPDLYKHLNKVKIVKEKAVDLKEKDPEIR